MNFVLAMLLVTALHNAHDGDTLQVHGVYHEHVVITNRVSLVGDAVIDGDGTGTPLTILAPRVEVRGLTVRNGGTDTGHYDSGIMIRAAHVTVADCRVERTGFGIYIRGTTDNRIEHNTIIGNTNLVASSRGNGIHLWKTARNVIAGNTIRETRDGIYLSYADDNLIVSNRVEDTRFGLHYMYSNRNRLLDNTFTGNSVGAALMFSRDCLVEGNVADANRRHGMMLKQVDTSRIIRNVLRNQNRGLLAQQSAKNWFEGNVIADNDIGLYLSNGSEDNVFVGNWFLNNTDQVWQPPDEVDLGRLASNRFYDKHRGNYWSDYTGNGSTPYHETDVFGYIVDRHPEARILALSPAATLLRRGEELLPLLDTPGVTDPYPLVRR